MPVTYHKNEVEALITATGTDIVAFLEQMQLPDTQLLIYNFFLLFFLIKIIKLVAFTWAWAALHPCRLPWDLSQTYHSRDTGLS